MLENIHVKLDLKGYGKKWTFLCSLSCSVSLVRDASVHLGVVTKDHSQWTAAETEADLGMLKGGAHSVQAHRKATFNSTFIFQLSGLALVSTFLHCTALLTGRLRCT